MSNHQTPLVLIVDDDAFQRTLIRETLEDAGFACEEAADGESGLKKAFELRPGLVILDVLMPQRDGFSVCHDLRRRIEGEALPVLMITALDTKENVMTAGKEGVDAYIIKPFSVQTIIAKIDEAIGKRQGAGGG